MAGPAGDEQPHGQWMEYDKKHPEESGYRWYWYNKEVTQGEWRRLAKE
jgi:hypothetical protein